MHEKRFNREIERLRDPERLARLEVNRCIDLALAELKNIHTVLDIGAGSGVFAEAFAARGLLVSGVDANADMLPVAAGYVPTGSFKEGTAENLPFEDKSFDLLFMGLVLHETDNTPAAFSQAYRVCKKRLAILEWPFEAQPFGPPMEHRIKPETVSDLAQKAGFNNISPIRLQNLIFYCCDIS